MGSIYWVCCMFCILACIILASITGHFISERKFAKANVSIILLFIAFVGIIISIVVYANQPSEPIVNETIIIEEGGTTAVYDRSNTKITVETDGKTIVYDMVEPTTEN